MTNLTHRIETFMLRKTGPKRNQHCINMDGYKVYYEQLGSK